MSQTAKPRNASHPGDLDFDPLEADHLADPYPFYARFREEAPNQTFEFDPNVSFHGPRELWAEWTPTGAA